MKNLNFTLNQFQFRVVRLFPIISVSLVATYQCLSYNWAIAPYLFVAVLIGLAMDANMAEVESRTRCRRKICSPQLMVMDISDKSVYDKCKKKMRRAKAKMVFNVSVMSSVPVDEVSVLLWFLSFKDGLCSWSFAGRVHRISPLLILKGIIFVYMSHFGFLFSWGRGSHDDSKSYSF